MRIVRPGSVVGPQQQYMYLKQLEWSKWAAVDEMRKIQTSSPIVSTAVVTPATPPAETDEDMDNVNITPILIAPVPPVTPSRHIAAGTAKAKAIPPPGQPRKTPQAKRSLAVVDSDEDEDDVLPALGIAPTVKPRAKRTTNRVTASDQRPTRVTRSTAGAANIRRTGAAATSALNGSSLKPPNKIPRLATTRNTGAAKAAAAPRTRRPQPPPTPSRLPTLIPSKRPHHNSASSLTDVATAATLNLKGAASDAWMTNNPSAVVVPATKSERPGLRPVRRRRSSFSAADVVA